MAILRERSPPARQDVQDTRYHMRTWPAAPSILMAYHRAPVLLDGAEDGLS